VTDIDPSLPLSCPRREAYCQLRALGVSRIEAYLEAARGRGKIPAREGAKVSAYQWETRRTDIPARIDWIRAQSASEGPRIAIRIDRGSALLPPVRRLSEALRRSLSRLQAEGGSETELAALRAVISAHAARALEIEGAVGGDDGSYREAGSPVRLDLSKLPRRRSCVCVCT